MPSSSVTGSRGTLDAVIQQLMVLERRRLEAVLLDCASSRRLADLHALYFELEAARRAGGVQ